LAIVRVNLLGSLQVDGSPAGTVLGAAKERSLLAALALNPGGVVPVDSLIAALWGEDPPAAARKTLQTYVWNLRQALGADAIATEPPGYALRIAPGDVDVGRFRALVRDGEAAMAAGDPAKASAVLGEAVALWRGEPFSGVAEHTGLAGEAVRLKQEYLSALETRISANLAAGRHTELVGELEALVRDHPFRERLWGYLMVALYRCGRQADALATYRRARELLVEELGLEPGGELRRIEESILRHDESVAAPDRLDIPVSAAAGTPGTILRSPVRYARSSDGVGIAYQVAGDGPIDILAIPGFVSHLDIWWNAPTDGLVRRLTSIGRLISFDKRGMGLSDRPDSVEAMKWVDDALAVLDSVGATNVVVLGVSAGAPTAIRLASLYPERVRALVIFAGGARTVAGPGYEIGHDRQTLESFAENLEKRWGSGVAISSYAPSRAKEPHVRDYWARYQQLSASPAAAMRSFWAAVETDVTDLLSTISAPTLVLHPERDIIVPVEWGRFVADRIPHAEFVALNSDVDLICVSDVIVEMAHEIGEFIHRNVHSPDSTRLVSNLTP
jgi:DNA-binding SARP family transcriptional activator/pimeloyl-ACP methyl ester carboxylesterase